MCQNVPIRKESFSKNDSIHCILSCKARSDPSHQKSGNVPSPLKSWTRVEKSLLITPKTSSAKHLEHQFNKTQIHPG